MLSRSRICPVPSIRGSILGPVPAHLCQRRPEASRSPRRKLTSTQNSLPIYPSLRDRAVLVTGGATGIGESLVRHFARQGSRVAFLDIQDEPARELVDSLTDEGCPTPLYSPLRPDRRRGPARPPSTAVLSDFRWPRRARQQCRQRPAPLHRRSHARILGPLDGRQSASSVLLHSGRPARHARAAARLDH